MDTAFNYHGGRKGGGCRGEFVGSVACCVAEFNHHARTDRHHSVLSVSIPHRSTAATAAPPNTTHEPGSLKVLVHCMLRKWKTLVHIISSDDNCLVQLQVMN